MFVIKPKFTLKTFSSNGIRIDLTDISSSAICESSISPNLTSNISQVKSNRFREIL